MTNIIDNFISANFQMSKNRSCRPANTIQCRRFSSLFFPLALLVSSTINTSSAFFLLLLRFLFSFITVDVRFQQGQIVPLVAKVICNVRTPQKNRRCKAIGSRSKITSWTNDQISFDISINVLLLLLDIPSPQFDLPSHENFILVLVKETIIVFLYLFTFPLIDLRHIRV